MNKEHKIIDRIVSILPLLTVVFILLVGGIRLIDATSGNTKHLQTLECTITDEAKRSKAEDTAIRFSLATVEKSTQIELTKIQVQLSAIDTHLLYIRKSMDEGAI